MKLPLVLTAVVSMVSVLSTTTPSSPAQDKQEQHDKQHKTKPDQKGDQDSNKDPDIAGLYECQGLTPDGKLYQGIVQIARNNGTYQLLWTLGPEEHHLGIGLLSGDVLAVSYFGGSPGVVAYRVEQGSDGPRLLGEWTVPDADGEVFREVLTRIGDGAELPLPLPRPQDSEPRTRPTGFSRLRAA